MTVNPATQPANVGGIMQDMFSKMVTPNDVNAGSAPNPPGAGVNTVPPPMPPVTASPAAAPVNTPAPPKAAAPEAPKEPVKTEAISSNVETNFFTDDTGDNEEAPPQDLEADAEPDMSDVPETPAAENFKKMREALKNDRKALKLKEKESKKLAAELEAWSKGEKIPDVLTAKDTRIQELEKYEIMLNGQLSTEYQELVVKPSIAAKNEFTKLAEDYAVPENLREPLIKKIVETESEKDRNALITKYFPDAIAATKAKDLVTKMHELGQTALEMEKKPLETKQTLQAKYQEKLELEDKERAGVFENVSKSAWNSAIEKTAAEGIYSDLLIRPGDSEHNKIAEKNQHRAAIQFGALVKELKANGLKQLPDRIAQGIARMTLLSIGGVGAYKQLQKVSQELAEIKESSSVQTTYFRPGANGNGFSAPVTKTPDNGPLTPQEAAKRAGQTLIRK